MVSEGEVEQIQLCLRLSVPLSTELTVPLTFGITGTTATSGTGIQLYIITHSQYCD